MGGDAKIWDDLWVSTRMVEEREGTGEGTSGRGCNEHVGDVPPIDEENRMRGRRGGARCTQAFNGVLRCST